MFEVVFHLKTKVPHILKFTKMGFKVYNIQSA